MSISSDYNLRIDVQLYFAERLTEKFVTFIRRDFLDKSPTAEDSIYSCIISVIEWELKNIQEELEKLKINKEWLIHQNIYNDIKAEELAIKIKNANKYLMYFRDRKEYLKNIDKDEIEKIRIILKKHFSQNRIDDLHLDLFLHYKSKQKIEYDFTSIYNTTHDTIKNGGLMPASRNLKSEKKIIYERLKHLKGNNLHKEKIMSDEEFDRLLLTVCELVFNNNLPEDTRAFSLNGISGSSIKYTLYKIHCDIFSNTPIKDIFIQFLQTYFPDKLGNWEFKNLKIKFSVKPSKYPW